TAVKSFPKGRATHLRARRESRDPGELGGKTNATRVDSCTMPGESRTHTGAGGSKERRGSMNNNTVFTSAAPKLEACTGAFAASAYSGTTADDPNNANLTYWYWAESDAPGANGWLKKEVALYEKTHPKVKITIVLQSTDTLTSAFTTASQTKSGPDIATQW